MKVKTKLILGFFIIYLLFGLAVFISVYEGSKSLEKTVSQDLLSMAGEISGHIDREINERVESFKAYSKDTVLQQLVAESNTEFEKMGSIQSYINQKDLEWASAPKNDITPFMKELMDNQLSKELREKIKFYEKSFGYRLYGEIFVTNKYGANAAQTGKTTDYRQDDEDWWQKAKADEIYTEDLKYDQSSDVYSTAIGIRVDDDNGNFIGIIKVVLNIEAVIKIISEAEAEKRYSTVEYTLVDGNGKIIFSTNKFEIFGPFEMFSEINEKNNFFLAKDPKTGADKLIVHAHSKGYRDFKSLGWIMIIEVGRDDILNPIRRLELNILIFAIVLIMLAGVIGFYIYSSISTPLRKFEDAINTIAKGNLDARVDIKSKDEFFTLAKAFNSMTDQLKSLKKVEKKQKMEKELEALEASYKTGFISEETYKKERGRLEENIIKAKTVDVELLAAEGFIKKGDEK